MKDVPPARTNHNLPHGANNVFVVCEGAFGYGNSTLYDWQPAKDSVFGDLYKVANGGLAMGDIFQNMTRIGNRFFLCINNSDKILVIDATTYSLIKTIDVPQPRYILDVGNGTAYVTALYGNKVYRLNTQSLDISDTITVDSHNPEGMCLLNNEVFVCCWDTGNCTVSVLDATSGQTHRQIRVAGYAPQEALVDKEQMLWVLSGDSPDGRTAAFTRLDPSTGVILDSFIFPATVNPVKPAFNPTRDTLYFIEANYSGGSGHNGIYRMSIHDHHLPSVAFFTAGAYSYFWALGVDPVNGMIYAGDPKGFIQAGIVYSCRQDGVKTDSFKVGTGPGHFYFDY